MSSLCWWCFWCRHLLPRALCLLKDWVRLRATTYCDPMNVSKVCDCCVLSDPRVSLYACCSVISTQRSLRPAFPQDRWNAQTCSPSGGRVTMPGSRSGHPGNNLLPAAVRSWLQWHSPGTPAKSELNMAAQSEVWRPLFEATHSQVTSLSTFYVLPYICRKFSPPTIAVWVLLPQFLLLHGQPPTSAMHAVSDMDWPQTLFSQWTDAKCFAAIVKIFQQLPSRSVTFVLAMYKQCCL